MSFFDDSGDSAWVISAGERKSAVMSAASLGEFGRIGASSGVADPGYRTHKDPLPPALLPLA
jgi:hypothetical protein